MKSPAPTKPTPQPQAAPALDHGQEESARTIAFGWDRTTDERSCQAFVQRFSRPGLLAVLTPRLTDHELTGLVNHLSELMKAHLSESEYHRLFLTDPARKRV